MLYRFTFISITLFLISTMLFSQDLINSNTNIIIHNETNELIINSRFSATQKIDIRFTVLNEAGYNYSIFKEFHDPFIRIKSLSGKILDKNGNTIRQFNLKDCKDISLSMFSTYDDNRIYIYEPHVDQYPFTVQYNYVIGYYGILNYPVWQPKSRNDISVEKASLVVRTNDYTDVRFKNYNIAEPNMDNTKNKKTYTWKLDSIPASSKYAYMSKNRDIYPTVYLAPNRFELQFRQGKMSSWKEFGLWVNSLTVNNESLPDDVISEIKRITSFKNSKAEKVKVVYKYMQSRTRYVSIQLGIGGWRPFSPSKVHELGYGDCKALTNYMKELLKAANIKSFYTLVKAGTNMGNIITDFPHNQFNHVILCVPNGKDSIWLECTSQTMPFNYLGSFTSDRNALIVKGSGGELARTPSYDKLKNYISENNLVKINSDGQANIHRNKTYYGLEIDKILNVLNENKRNQKQYYNQSLPLNDFTINKFKLHMIDSVNLVVEENLHLEINNYATQTKTRMFFPLNIEFTKFKTPQIKHNREIPIEIKSSQHIKRSYSYSIPSNMNIESIPKNISIEKPFGLFIFEYKSENDKIKVNTTLKINKGIYDSTLEKELKNFFVSINKINSSQIVLKLNN